MPSVRVGIAGPPGRDGTLANAFLMRMTPTVITDFGIGRSASSNLPTVTALTDTDGRPFIRFASPLDSSTKMLPILDSVGAPVIGSKRFRVEMYARWTAGLNPGMRAGIGFNTDQVGSLLTCYAVANGGNAGTSFDSFVSGTAETQLVANAAAYDASVDWTALHVDVWLDPVTGYCKYQYGPIKDALGVGLGVQRRKTTLVTAAGTGLALYVTGGAGYLDIAELIVWKNERSWT